MAGAISIQPYQHVQAAPAVYTEWIFAGEETAATGPMGFSIARIIYSGNNWKLETNPRLPLPELLDDKMWRQLLLEGKLQPLTA